MFNLNFYPISHYQPFKKIRFVFYSYRFAFLLIYLVYALANYGHTVVSPYLIASLFYLFIASILNYQIEKKTTLLLIANTPKETVKTRFYILNKFIGWTLPLDALAGFCLLFDYSIQHEKNESVFIFTICLCCLIAGHVFYFPTYSKGKSWIEKYRFSHLLKGGVSASIALIVFLLLLSYVDSTGILENLRNQAYEYKYFLCILLIVSMSLPLTLRLILEKDRRKAKSMRENVLNVTNQINKAIEALEINNKIEDAVNTNELATLIGKAMEVEFFSIGKVIKEANGVDYVQDVGIYVNRKGIPNFQIPNLESITKLPIEDSFIGNVLLSDAGFNNTNGKPPAINEVNYKFYEDNLLPSKQHKSVIIIGLYDNGEGRNPIGYLHAINKLDKKEKPDILGFSREEGKTLKSYANHIELILNLKKNKEIEKQAEEVSENNKKAQERDKSLIEELLLMQTTNQIVLRMFEYINTEFDCHLASLWMPLQNGFVEKATKDNFNVLVRTVTANPNKYAGKERALEKKLMDSTNAHIDERKSYIGKLVYEKFKTEIETKIAQNKEENRDAEFELKIIYEPDQNKHDLNCWKGFQNEIKAESTITIPIYRTFNTKTDLRTGKAGKHWLDYLLGIICLRVDRKQFDVLLSDIPQERLEYLIKRLRVILENTIYQERFMQLERLKNKLLNIKVGDRDDEHRFYDEIVRGIAEAIECEGCSLFRPSENIPYLELKASTSENCTYLGEKHQTIDLINKPIYKLNGAEGITNRVHLEKKIFITSDISKEHHEASGLFIEEDHPDYRFRSFMSIPIIIKTNEVSESLGVIRCIYKRNEGFDPTFNRLDSEFLDLIVGIITRLFVFLDNNRKFLKFINTFNHEIAQPLQVSMSYTDVIALKLEKIFNDLELLRVPEHHQKFKLTERELTVQSKELQHMKMILSNFNIYALENENELSKRYHPVGDTIKELKELLTRDSWSKSHIDFKVFINKMDDNFEMYVDLKKFKQVLYNLITNAIRYSNEGQIVSLYYDRLTDEYNKEWDTFAIKNIGIGIPEQDVDKIFDFGFRSAKAIKHSPTGTGIGLHVVKKIMLLHDGAIKIIHPGGSGEPTLIRIYFPITIKKEHLK